MLFLTRIRAISIVILLAFLTQACQTLNSNDNQNEDLTTIEIAVGEWKPFVTKDFEGYGEVPELITAILEEMGYQPVYKFMPWGQAERMVGDNEKDTGVRVTFPYAKTKKREDEFVTSSQPIFKACIRFFYNTDKVTGDEPLSISSIDDLKKYKIGYVSESGGYQYPEELNNILKKENAVDNLYEAFSKLVNPKDFNVQVVPEVEEVGEEFLYELFPENRFSIKIIEEKERSQKQCLVPVEYYFMASKRNPNNDEFMKEFNKTHKLIADSEIAERIKIKSNNRPTPNSPEITLDSCEKSSNLSGRNNKNQIYHLPRGTKGLLLDWNMVQAKENTSTEVEATVKILTGPYRGKILTVDGRCLTLH